MATVSFRGLGEAPRGTLTSLLRSSYAPWASSDPSLFQRWERGWRKYDDDVHENPDSIGKAGFLVSVGGVVIGFSSWDPRPFPTVDVGHNCILPALRGHGHGIRQVQHLVAVLRAAGFTRAVARTGEVEFFAPARAMYERCGFVRTATHPPGAIAPFSVAEYVLAL